MPEVRMLPTAAAEPPPRKRRPGPLPKGIGRFLEAKYRRSEAKRELERQAFKHAEEARQQRQRAKLEKLLGVLNWLQQCVQSGHLRSLVLAADVAGLNTKLYALGEAEENFDQALFLAARLQHRIASCIEGEESSEE